MHRPTIAVTDESCLSLIMIVTLILHFQAVLAAQRRGEDVETSKKC